MTIDKTSFLSLPAELRIQIYSYLVAPRQPSYATSSIVPRPTLAHVAIAEYASSRTATLTGPDILSFRIVDPQATCHNGWADNVLPTLRRTQCLIRTDRFRSRTMQTTYSCLNNPGIDPAILATSKQIHAEAAEVLYGSWTFDFDTHVEAISAFVNDLGSTAKACVRSMGLVKRATPYDRDFDRCEWASATCSLAALPALRTLHLGIVAGKPGPNGWDDAPVWSCKDFADMARWRDWNGFEWVRELARVRVINCGNVKIAGVKVRAIVEHCPHPGSEGMLFWIGVSKNVDGGFGEFVEAVVIGNGKA